MRMGHPWKNLMASAATEGTRLAKGILIGLTTFEAVNNWRSFNTKLTYAGCLVNQ